MLRILGIYLIVFYCFKTSAINNEVFLLKNVDELSSIEQVLKSTSFVKIDPSKDLNFGITNTTHWVKIAIKNFDISQNYVLHIETITPDSIEVYQKIDDKWKHSYIGEGFFSKERFLNYHFQTSKAGTEIYLKVIGNGQPIALPIEIISEEKHQTNMPSLFFHGISYGIVVLILILNVILYIVSFDRLYLYTFLYNIFASIVLLYFDGFIKFFLIQHSLYWNNEAIAIGICGSFFMTNFYIPEFIKLHTYKTIYNFLFKLASTFMVVLVLLSFWHPTGFKYWICINVGMLTLESILLFYAVLYIRKKEKDYFFWQFASVLALIVFGTVSQLYFLGFLTINYLTVNVIRYMVLSQIFLQTFALGSRISVIIREKSMLQDSLLRLSEQHSQSLILTLENERKRFSSDFHDTIGQNILVMRNKILLMLKKEKLKTGQVEKLNILAELTSETLDDIRAIVQDLRPTMLDSVGIYVAIEQMVEKVKKSTSIKINYLCDKNIDNILPKDMEINFYRIIQELFNNLIKHSQAKNATLSIKIEGIFLNLFYEDNGIGFDTKNSSIAANGNGLSTIKDRIKILKGNIDMFSQINKGTSFTIQIPIV